MTRQAIHTSHLHCAVCGACQKTTAYDDGTIDVSFEPHDVAAHTQIIARTVAARWN